MKNDLLQWRSPAVLNKKKQRFLKKALLFWGRLNEEAGVIPAGAGSKGDLSRASH
jgi:hypothetical protein